MIRKFKRHINIYAFFKYLIKIEPLILIIEPNNIMRKDLKKFKDLTLKLL